MNCIRLFFATLQQIGRPDNKKPPRGTFVPETASFPEIAVAREG
jgi:hypothetical protein